MHARTLRSTSRCRLRRQVKASTASTPGTPAPDVEHAAWSSRCRSHSAGNAAIAQMSMSAGYRCQDMMCRALQGGCKARTGMGTAIPGRASFTLLEICTHQMYSCGRSCCAGPLCRADSATTRMLEQKLFALHCVREPRARGCPGRCLVTITALYLSRLFARDRKWGRASARMACVPCAGSCRR